jgi:secreted trypsin-like serine protease
MGIWGCGGSLITPNVVLSAAHCGKAIGSTFIIGAYKNKSLDHGAVSRLVIRSETHPLYRQPSRHSNDYALHLLQTPVTISTQIKLQLNTDASIPQPNDLLTVIGTGALQKDGDAVPDYLQKVNVPVIDTNKCNGIDYYSDRIEESMLCAGTMSPCTVFIYYISS